MCDEYVYSDDPFIEIRKVLDKWNKDIENWDMFIENEEEQGIKDFNHSQLSEEELAEVDIDTIEVIDLPSFKDLDRGE